MKKVLLKWNIRKMYSLATVEQLIQTNSSQVHSLMRINKRHTYKVDQNRKLNMRN